MQHIALDHCLTDDQRDAFDRDGYLIVEGALSPSHVSDLLDATDTIHREQIAQGLGEQELMSLTDIVRRDRRLLDMIDHRVMLPKVWGVLGWNIYLYHAHLDVTPPMQHSEVSESQWRRWHQDSMRVNDEIECRPRPRLSVKVAYFLSDTTVPNCGNMLIAPGSHLDDDINFDATSGDPANVSPLTVKPGTAVLFDRRLWHSRSRNVSNVTRKAVFFGYGYRWLQRKDDMQVDGLMDDADAIRRQLLGARTNSDGLYDPKPDDVPLRDWLIEHDALDTARQYHRAGHGGRAPL